MLTQSLDREGMGYTDAYGGREEFLRRAGTVAQRRHTRKATLLDASSSATLSWPETPTSIPTSPDLDFPLPSSIKSSPNTSDGSTAADGHDSITSQPFDAPHKSFDLDKSTAPPKLPQPHIPLRRTSATNLRQKGYQYGDDDFFAADARSPVLAVFPERISSRTNSPRLRKDRQASDSSKENISPKDDVHPDIRGRRRGLTSASQRPPLLVDSSFRSPSIPDLRSSYRPNRGPSSGEPSMILRNPPPLPWRDNEEVRASFRSALTNGSIVGYASSGYYDASETERSSVITRSSSLSDYSKSRVLSMEDDDFSVDDAIAMYANGFTDDATTERPDERTNGRHHSSARSPLTRSLTDPTSVAEVESADMQRPSNDSTYTRNDSKFDDGEFRLPISPSIPQAPISPLRSHLVNPASPPSPLRSPRPAFSFRPECFPSPVSPLKPGEGFDFGPVSPMDPATVDSDSSPIEASTAETSPVDNTLADKAHPAMPLKEQQYDPVPRDRYGFKKVTPYVTLEQYDAWNIGYTDYLERRKSKWEIMMMQWGLPIQDPVRFPSRSDKVKRYIRKGIPPQWRGACWFWYAGGPTRLAQNPGLYEILVEKAENGYLNDIDREIIERDLNRTFPDNAQFKPDPTPDTARDSSGQPISTDGPNGDLPMIKALRRVLQAFAVHNPGIGYCQSLNFITGMLLLFLQDEEKSFHMLNVITTTHLPGTHAKVLEANVDVGVLMNCIKDSMPAVWTKIDDINEGRGAISTSRLPTVSLATTAWFMSCFIGNLPTESVLRVWDSFFYEGSKTLFRIALAVFKTGESEIRNVNEHMEIFQVVQAIPRRLLDANSLMESCYKRRNGFGHLSQDIIDSRRKERRTQLQKDRDRKNGQVSPGATGEPVRGRGRASTLKRAASKARIMRIKSPALPEPMPGTQF